jgi:hypothetical protein
MKNIEIFISDLKEEAREEVEKVVGKENNYDVIPLFMVSVED